MTQLALYEKRYGKRDASVFSFFRRDYVYRKNTWTRVYVLFGALVMLGLYWFHRIFVQNMEIGHMEGADIQGYVIEGMLFLAAVMAVYTLIGTIQGAHRYHKVQQRTDQYLATLRILEDLDCNDILEPTPATEADELEADNSEADDTEEDAAYNAKPADASALVYRPNNTDTTGGRP